MTLIQCEECKSNVSDRAQNCPHCGNPLQVIHTQSEEVLEYQANGFIEGPYFGPITEQVNASPAILVKLGKAKRLFWFLIANAAIVLSLTLISGGALLGFMPFVLLLGCTFPFITLLLSRWLAKRSHGIQIIQPDFQSDEQEGLYTLVTSLCKRAGLRIMPEVGIYQSEEMNAFATGRSRNSSLVAFSSGLLESMDERGIAAVAAHEIAHIANGDMVTITLVQSVVNTVVLLCTIPLKLIEWLAFFSDSVSAVAFWITSIIRFLITLLLVFLGSLVVKAFSRRREFQADKLASELLDKDSMIHALESLKHDKPVVMKKQRGYAALKISSPKRFMDLFSTHPSLEKRIFALQKLVN